MSGTSYDAALRRQLRSLRNQADFARTIGRRQPWLHKYANGAGHASIDDVIAIARAFPGWSGSLDQFLTQLAGTLPQPHSERDMVRTQEERRLLRLWREATDGDDRTKLLALIETYVDQMKRLRRAQRQQERVSDRPAAAERKSRGKRRVVGEA